VTAEALSGDIRDLARARAIRLEADRRAPMSDRLGPNAHTVQAAERDQGRSGTLSGFDLRSLLEALDDHDVRFVVIGGVAVGAHGFVRGTEDLENLPEN
jgi:hypothetical protein